MFQNFNELLIFPTYQFEYILIFMWRIAELKRKSRLSDAAKQSVCNLDNPRANPIGAYDTIRKYNYCKNLLNLLAFKYFDLIGEARRWLYIYNGNYTIRQSIYILL
jgi:hypothetical protein